MEPSNLVLTQSSQAAPLREAGRAVGADPQARGAEGLPPLGASHQGPWGEACSSWGRPEPGGPQPLPCIPRSCSHCRPRGGSHIGQGAGVLPARLWGGLTCALSCLHQPLAQDIPQPGLHGERPLLAHQGHHQVGSSQVPLGQQEVEELGGGHIAGHLHELQGRMAASGCRVGGCWAWGTGHWGALGTGGHWGHWGTGHGGPGHWGALGTGDMGALGTGG